MRDDDELLPITANALSSAPGLLEAVRTIGAERGFDYLDDQSVRQLLEDQRRTVHRARTGWRSWVGGTAFVVGCAAGAFLLASGLNGPLRAWPAPALAAICAVLCGWGLAC